MLGVACRFTIETNNEADAFSIKNCIHRCPVKCMLARFDNGQMISVCPGKVSRPWSVFFECSSTYRYRG